MGKSCYCPEMPAITEPTGEPVACACCGEPLELTCPRRCKDATANLGTRLGTLAVRRKYKPKRCVGCGRLFHPSGPRSLYCDRCPTTPADSPPDSDSPTEL